MATPITSTSAPALTVTTFNALTTTFTPPQPCMSQLTATIEQVDQPPAYDPYFLGGIHGDPFIPSSCYPSSWAPTGQVFSPGLCPSGYNSGCLNTRSLATAIETGAICCPNSWFCDTALYSLIGGSSMPEPWVATYPCVTFLNDTVTVLDFSIGVSSVVSNIQVNAFGVSIRWQQTDFVTTTTNSIPSPIGPLPLSTANPVISASTPSVVAAPTSNQETPTSVPGTSSLSMGAKIGIGIGVPMATLAAAAILIFYLLSRRWKNKKERNIQREPYFVAVSPSLKGTEIKDIPEPVEAEIGGGSIYELDASTRTELEGNNGFVHEVKGEYGNSGVS